jgi:sarcosine oxidase
MKAQTFDVAVVGGGIVGLATARVLAGRGRRVTLLERGDLSRPSGSSRGSARIWHFAGYPTEEYLDHGIQSVERWCELERETGLKILLDVGGGLSYGAGVEEQAELLRRAGRECELLGERQLRHRWPRLTLPQGESILHQRDAGVILARAAMAALLASARRAGAALADRTEVQTLCIDGGGVTVSTDGETIHADCAVVAAGPWSARLLKTAAIDLDVRVTEQTIAWFSWHGAPPPTLIEFGRPDPYALFDPAGGLKAGLHEPGLPVEDPDALHGPGREADLLRLADWVANRFSLPRARPVRVETCRYTWSPDESFVIDRRGDVVVASACSGQGFQYAPRTGELVADLVR